LLQSFVIQSQQDIHELQAQCQLVTIQVRVESEEDPQENASAPTPKNTADENTDSSPANAPVQLGPQTKQKVKYINQVSFERAVESSRLTFDSARSMASQIMNGLRVGRSLDINECRQHVESVVESVLSNKDALRFLAMIKNKDEYTAEHSINVCILCATFARHLGLLEYEIKIVALCGLLHDVGKSKVPNEILNKPGRFTKEEAYIMAEHPTYGRNILMSTAGDQRHAVDVAHCHHERVDSKGYPRCLNARQIPYYSKIVSIVDAYDAMTSERCYGKPKTSYAALKIIADNAGSQFDRELAHEFIRCIGFYSAGVLVELKGGQLAIVVKANEKDQARPKILVVTNAEKKRIQKPAFIDLEKPENARLSITHEVPNGTAGVDVKQYISRKLFS
jgi:putative nucleotidyltransferase with HDIG domain